MPSEAALQSLYSVLQEILGPENADTLMTHFSRDPAADAATRADMARVDQRFDQIDRKFERVNQRFDQIDRKFEQVDQRFEAVDKRFDRLEAKVDSLHSALIEQTKFYAKTTVWAMTGLTGIYSFIVYTITNLR